MKQTFFYFLILIGISLKSQNLVLSQSFNQPAVGDTNLVYPMDTLGFSSGIVVLLMTGYTAAALLFFHLSEIKI